MPKLIFDTCCCCIKLKTGCLIIGYLHLVAEIIFSIVDLVMLALVAWGVVATSDDKDKQAAGVGFIAYGFTQLVWVAILLAFTITLLVGLHKNKRGHVKDYLICCAIFWVLFFASLIEPDPILRIIFKCFFLLLEVFFFLVIRSQYYKMDDANNGAIYNTA